MFLVQKRGFGFNVRGLTSSGCSAVVSRRDENSAMVWVRERSAVCREELEKGEMERILKEGFFMGSTGLSRRPRIQEESSVAVDSEQ